MHEPLWAPTKDILDRYKKKIISWKEYEDEFYKLMVSRKIEMILKKKYATYEKVLLLCSEPTPEFCHRRLIAEYLKVHADDIIIRHL